MRFEDVEKNEFDVRLQQVLDQRNCPDSDALLSQLAYKNEETAARLRAAEFIASPPAMVMYPTADFADRILAKIRAEDAAEMKQRNTPIWRRKSTWYGGIGLAVAASVTIALGIWNSQSGSNQFAGKPNVEPSVAEAVPGEEGAKPELVSVAEPLPSTLEDISKRLDVRQEKVAQLRSGLNPFRSTLNVTLHVIRATVPNRPHQSPQRPVDGKSSTSILNTRWIV